MWPLAVLLGLGVVLNGYNIYRTVGARQLSEVYISNWYILGAFCWLPILYVTAYLPFYQSGVGNVVIQGYYMHTAVGMWFTMLALGTTYYALPRVLGRPIYSYALGVLGFWTNMLFYTVVGAHHFIFSPVPYWLQTTAILFSVGMMVPVWAGTGNFLLTLRGAWHGVRRSYALPFLLVGILGYGLGSSQGTFEAFRTANIYLHFTNFTVGHSHATMYGFIAFIIWGAAYGLVPQFTGREPNPIIVGVHFWLALVGVVIYVVALSVAGVLQGAAWVAGRSFIASIVAAEPLWLWRTVGGLLMAVTKTASPIATTRNSHLSEMDWNQIDEPGCYLFVDTGQLARVPQEALAPPGPSSDRRLRLHRLPHSDAGYGNPSGVEGPGDATSPGSSSSNFRGGARAATLSQGRVRLLPHPVRAGPSHGPTLWPTLARGRLRPRGPSAARL